MNFIVNCTNHKDLGDKTPKTFSHLNYVCQSEASRFIQQSDAGIKSGELYVAISLSKQHGARVKRAGLNLLILERF